MRLYAALTQRGETRDMTGFETEFTPIQSLIGGILIGLSAVMLMASLGRIMGATGIVAGLIRPTSAQDASWRLAVLAGMVTGPLALLLIGGMDTPVQVPVSTLQLIAGGLVVGVGVTLGGGCTSGHGVCGMARLSPRSIAATLTFMATTGVTVYVTRHLIGG